MGSEEAQAQSTGVCDNQFATARKLLILKTERCWSGRSGTLGNCSDGLRRCAADFDYRCEANHLTAIASTPSIAVNLSRSRGSDSVTSQLRHSAAAMNEHAFRRAFSSRSSDRQHPAPKHWRIWLSCNGKCPTVRFHASPRPSSLNARFLTNTYMARHRTRPTSSQEQAEKKSHDRPNV